MLGRATSPRYSLVKIYVDQQRVDQQQHFGAIQVQSPEQSMELLPQMHHDHMPEPP